MEDIEILQQLQVSNPLIYNAIHTLLQSFSIVKPENIVIKASEDTTGGEHPPQPPNHP